MKLIIFLFIFALWIILLTIFFTLAYFYKLSHVSFYDKRDEMIKLFKTKDSVVLTPLEDYDISFELSEDEKLYIIESNLGYVKKLVNKKTSKIENESINNEFFILKEAFKIKPPSDFLDYNSLYITNNKIVIENDSEYMLIPFSKINKLLYSLSRYKTNWFASLSINTEKHYYKILIKYNDTIKILRNIYGEYLNEHN